MLSKEAKMDQLKIADRTFRSRLLIGSTGYPDLKTMSACFEASGAEIVTVAIRRINLQEKQHGSILQHIDRSRYFLLPNTAGCYTAKEAILTAQLAREALETNWIKLEIIGDEKTLFPDVIELVEAADVLVRDGFIVLPYCNDDLIICQKLADLGCAAVMPLGAPIGSGMGIRNPYNLQIIREQIDIPLIIDAGVGTASDAVLAMEMGVDGLLINTAIAKAQHPILMAEAMSLGCRSGRLAYIGGRIPKRLYAQASTVLEGMIEYAYHAHH
jgi:thiazole synthase